MNTLSRIGLALAAVAMFVAVGNYAVTAQSNGNDNNISVMDDCLPGDPDWHPTGGCTRGMCRSRSSASCSSRR